MGRRWSILIPLPIFSHPAFLGKAEETGLEVRSSFRTLNPGFKDRAIAKSEVVMEKAPDEVEGILYYPQEYVAGRKYPLMLAISWRAL